MVSRQARLLVLLFPSFLAGCATSPARPLAVVEFVDPQRYVGVWYEIARYPASFEKGCAGATAEYTTRPDGKIRVVNRCRDGALDGPERSVEGVARVVDPQTNAKLKIMFFWPFEGDYWIIDLDRDHYQWAVVGEPRRKFLWILARAPALEEAVYNDILSRLPEKSYDPARLQKTPQPAAP